MAIVLEVFTAQVQGQLCCLIGFFTCQKSVSLYLGREYLMMALANGKHIPMEGDRDDGRERGGRD